MVTSSSVISARIAIGRSRRSPPTFRVAAIASSVSFRVEIPSSWPVQSASIAEVRSTTVRTRPVQRSWSSMRGRSRTRQYSSGSSSTYSTPSPLRSPVAAEAAMVSAGNFSARSRPASSWATARIERGSSAPRSLASKRLAALLANTGTIVSSTTWYRSQHSSVASAATAIRSRWEPAVARSVMSVLIVSTAITRPDRTIGSLRSDSTVSNRRTWTSTRRAVRAASRSASSSSPAEDPTTSAGLDGRWPMS